MSTLHTRRADYEAVATRLALLSDRQVESLWRASEEGRGGIGGATKLVEIAGRPVFAKALPLTDLELCPEHVRSTANLFGLPTFYQYGVGSTGFGAWRELAAHVMTTNWVLAGQSAGFPLMYHWRVLPGALETPSGAGNL